MVKEKSVIGTIATADKSGLEVFDVKSLDSCCALVNSAVENNGGLFFRGEQLEDLLIQTYRQWDQRIVSTFIKVIAIFVLQFTNLFYILKLCYPPLQSSQFF